MAYSEAFKKQQAIDRDILKNGLTFFYTSPPNSEIIELSETSGEVSITPSQS